jgi:ERCC4-related helicase
VSDIDVKALEDLKDVLQTNNGHNGESKNNNSNLYSIIAVLASCATVISVVFYIVTAKVEPLGQQLSYVQEEMSTIRESISILRKMDTESLQDRATMGERFQKVETQFQTLKEEIENVSEWRNWWYTNYLPKDAAQTNELGYLNKRIEKLNDRLHPPILPQKIQ